MAAAAAASAASSATDRPASVQGDTSYRARFDETFRVLGVVVHDPRTMSGVVKALQKQNLVYNRRAVTSVVDVANERVVERLLLHAPSAAAGEEQQQRKTLAAAHARVILLEQPVPASAGDGTATSTTISQMLSPATIAALVSTLPAEQQTLLRQQEGAAQRDALLAARFSVAACAVRLSHANYSSTEILARLLPEGVVVPSGFEQVGHIAHLNLLPCHNDYKRLIAQVLIDCSAGQIRTVVNKTEALSSVFRELPFELLAGDAEYTATVKQHGVEFRVPYDTVYWNSKLSHEHTRLVTEAMQPGDELLDVMAGVGPFAVPAALQQRVRVFANDLNPAAAEAMRVNARINQVREGTFDVFNMDGRAFVAEMREKRLKLGRIPTAAAAAVGSDDQKQQQPQQALPAGAFRRHALRHFVMNLPATAVLFLDAFVGEGWPAPVASSSSMFESGAAFDHTFVVHVYCFSASSDNSGAVKDAVAQVAKVLGKPVGDGDATAAAAVLVHRVHVVRDVAPNKLMVCVSFSPQIVAPPAMHAALRDELRCFANSGSGAADGGAGSRRAREEK